MLLEFKDFGSVRNQAVFFLHGLLGSSDNWKTTCLDISSEGLRCIAVDQRNHGNSPHSSEMSYPIMAADLIELADHLGIETFSILGHSMGGKTAMETALSFPERVLSLVVEDIAPVGYDPAYLNYINALKTIDTGSIKSRSEAVSSLEKVIPDRSLIMFFLTNLRRGEDGVYRWRINVEGITDNYHNIWRAIDKGRVFNGPNLFIRGEKSDFIRDSYLPEISELFPAYRMEIVSGSGHWVHSEKPDQFRSLVKKFFAETAFYN